MLYEIKIRLIEMVDVTMQLDEKLLSSLLYSEDINVLCVADIKSIKWFDECIEAINLFCINFSANIVLRLVGKFDLTVKNIALKKIKENNLYSNVEIVDNYDNGKIMAYFLCSDCFLFIDVDEVAKINAIKAQKYKLPIIALRENKFVNVIGSRQLIVDNSRQLAAAIKIINENDIYRDYLIQNGCNN